jgi:membrane-associated HD superfamily phosphohydrolase
MFVGDFRVIRKKDRTDPSWLSVFNGINHNPWIRAKVKLLLSLILTAVALLTCYVEAVYLSLKPPHPGEILYLTIRSQRPFHFDQEKALGSKRHAALSEYTPLYSYRSHEVEFSKRRIQSLIEKVSTLSPSKKGDVAEFEKYLQKEFGVQVGMDGAAKIVQYPGLKNLLEAMLAVEESILQNRIVEDPEPLRGKKTVEVLSGSSLEPLAYPASEVLTLEEARDLLKTKIFKIFWQVDKFILDPMIQIALGTVTPNLAYDQEENDRRIEKIIQRYPSKTVLFNSGEILVPFKKALGERDVLLLSAYLEMEKKAVGRTAPWILFSILSPIELWSFRPKASLALLVIFDPERYALNESIV